jgi:hypothetical protein
MDNTNPLKKSTPVYVSYVTLLSALDNLKNHGIPSTGIIDKSLWDTQSGAIQGQILLALRFLGLTDEQNRVQPDLVTLAKASPEQRKTLLRPIIEQKYRSVIAVGLPTISQAQLEDALRKFEISGSTLDRAVRFFVKACQECGIPLSARVAERVRASSSTPARRRKSANSHKRDADTSGASEENATPARIEDKLLDKFPPFDPAWPDAIKTKWFEGFDRLMKSSLGS